MSSSRRWRSWRMAVLALAVVAVPAGLAAAEKAEALHDDFEGARPSWKREEADATIRLLAHDRTNRAAHDGQRSEHFQFEAGPGSGFYFSYALPKIPVTDRLTVGLYVRSNRPGVQIKGRIVLPADRDPDTGEPSFVLVQGPIYEHGDRWQKLELIDFRYEAERQARVLRASTRRAVSLEGAYLDRLVINVYSGPGLSDVFVDDLTVTPVPATPAPATVGPPLPEPTLPRPEAAQVESPGANNLPVQLRGNYLSREGRGWVFTAIHAPGADVGALRRAGFDVLADDLRASRTRIEQAIGSGMMLMPMIGGSAPGEPVDPAQVAHIVDTYPYREAVAFWHLGRGLGRSLRASERQQELERVRSAIVAVHELNGPFSRLTTGEVDGDTALYTRAPRNLDVLGIRPDSWGSSLQPFDTFAYLGQRRSTAVWNPRELCWAWIPVVAPASVRSAIWGSGRVPDWGDPRVQPEQIRLNTYLALAKGYRGLGFLADANLTADQGQAQLIEMELLNEEIDLFESIIASGTDPYPNCDVKGPDPSLLPPPGGRTGQRLPPKPEKKQHDSIRATAIGTRDRKGVLLLMYDVAGAGQYQPPQMADQELWVTAIVPEGAQAFEFSPGGMRVLESTRGIGGRTIKVTDFGGTSLILMTTDFNLPLQLEAQINQKRSIAVQLAIRQAQLQYAWVAGINDLLVQQDHGYKEAPEMLALAAKSLEDARAYLEREDYLGAWTEARRTGRSLRLLMRVYWERAMEAIHKATDFGERAPKDVQPVDRTKKKPKIAQPRIMATGCAPCVAFNTLPQLHRLVDWLEDKGFGQNLVPSGSFDEAQALDENHWTPESYEYEGVSGKVYVTSATTYHDQGRALHLTVRPTDEKQGVDALRPFFDFPPVAVRSPEIPVTAEYLYRISVLVKYPRGAWPGAGGLIVRDSLGGETLQYRTSEKITDWSRVVIYRRAPEDGTLSVLLGLAGYGEAFFDDFRIEPVHELPPGQRRNVADRDEPEAGERVRSTAARRQRFDPTTR